MHTLMGWIVAWLCRWLPHSTDTGLFAIGAPDEHSPVIVTANFSLTVRRVRKALQGQNVWLLVANTEGINVWCAADGGIFNENRVIDVIKVSGLAEKVSHRVIILPALAASGIDVHAVKDETGFHSRFGPVYARDIPAYLEAGKKKTDAMRRFDFGFRHRLEMFLPMNLPVYLVVAIVLAIFWPQFLLGYTLLFWGAVASLYLLLDVIPGKTGWGQAFLAAMLVVLIWAGIDAYHLGHPLAHWGWLLATFAIFFAAGFDISGTVSPRRSDAEMMMHRLGFQSFGSLFSEKSLGLVDLDLEKCTGCAHCLDVCPIGVFGPTGADKKTSLVAPEACFACGACVKQCDAHALSQN